MPFGTGFVRDETRPALLPRFAVQRGQKTSSCGRGLCAPRSSSFSSPRPHPFSFSSPCSAGGRAIFEALPRSRSC